LLCYRMYGEARLVFVLKPVVVSTSEAKCILKSLRIENDAFGKHQVL